MRSPRTAIIAASTALAAVFVFASAAQAQGTRGTQSRPLTVQKRSFLDPGNIVPVGTEGHYFRDSTFSGGAPQSYFQPYLRGFEPPQRYEDSGFQFGG